MRADSAQANVALGYSRFQVLPDDEPAVKPGVSDVVKALVGIPSIAGGGAQAVKKGRFTVLPDDTEVVPTRWLLRDPFIQIKKELIIHFPDIREALLEVDSVADLQRVGQPLFALAANGDRHHIDLLRRLMEVGADVTGVDSQGHSLLDVVLRNASQDIEANLIVSVIDELIEKGLRSQRGP